jgi:hypothetical protein
MTAPGPVKFFDLDDSLGLMPETKGVEIISGVEGWSDILIALRQKDLWTETKTIVIDTMTRLEEFCGAHVIATQTTKKGTKVKSLTEYSRQGRKKCSFGLPRKSELQSSQSFWR